MSTIGAHHRGAERCVVCASNRVPNANCDHGVATVLGEGTYGQVFLCRMPDGTSYVEKVLKMDASITHQREVTCLSHCRHPMIVRMISASTTPVNGRVTVRMEHCEGGDLFRYISERRAARQLIPPNVVMSFVTQLLLAVHYLHSKSILHRDIKTSNLFLSADRSIVKLGDFGCSLKSDISIAEDQRRTLCGTWHSVAPELLTVDQQQRAEYGKKAETWSIGVVMYEMMMLQAPFACDLSDAASFNSMLTSILTGQYPAIPAGYGYPPAMVELCSSMLVVNKQDRPFVRTVLQSAACQSAARELISSSHLLTAAESQQLAEQLQSIQEPNTYVFQADCYRVRSSTSQIIQAQLRITESGQLLFRDSRHGYSAGGGEWSACQLATCVVEPDDFEEGDGKFFFGLCFRPHKLNPVTFGYFDEAERERLRAAVLRLLPE